MASPKTRRPRAETPKGFRDLFGAEVTERALMLDSIAAVYRSYGFDPLETSAVETVEALGKFLPDVDRPNEGVFAWQEDEADWLALRYDLTAPLARVYAQHRQTLPTPYRRYAMGPVWRNEKPGPGRFRQFYQCDADTVGTPTVAADAEIVMMLCDALEAAGIARGNYVVKINNRKVLNGILEVAKLLDPTDPTRFEKERGIVLRAIDKYDRLGRQATLELLTIGRLDRSGDYTEGAGLSKDQAALIMAIFDASNGYIFSGDPFDDKSIYLDEGGRTKREYLFPLLRNAMVGSATGNEGIDELEKIAEFVAYAGFESDRITFDTSVVRGLGYYTGPVFEAELTFQVVDDAGRPRQFGSVAGGGRYDDLVKRFTGESVPATGVSIGVDRLLTALHVASQAHAAEPGPVVVTVMDRDGMADALKLAAELRALGARAEAYLGNPKSFGKQLQYADRRRSPFAVIAGSEERARGVVSVKDLSGRARRLASDDNAPSAHQQLLTMERAGQLELPREAAAIEIARLWKEFAAG